eukprot:CAMPEP_0177769924 /NCGR_PEP_ID=MMETSP0491_2-20121128/10619_1 /TAXON_ID=63592 /ORGANISM="Tetraselmis chuii, Strain PLY429" /LENGTH=118 /DNA_ID=CAMNT_0019287041 /DNA_START=245 /DNA_END=601 /DNA_ORIENTATION=+
MSVSVLEQLKAKKEAISADLSKVEQSIYDLEGAYLAAECTQCGSVLKGFEGFLSSKDNIRKRARTFKVDDRLFSLSSGSSPAAVEIEQQGNDEREGNSGYGRGKQSAMQRTQSRNSLR